MAVCPICSNTQFQDFRGRAYAQCIQCKSLERHRFAFVIYKLYGLINEPGISGRPSTLHLAPERFFYDYFSTLPSYSACDANPERYRFGVIQRLLLPDDFANIKGKDYDFILHNHVLEHIPGHWYDHITSFVSALRIEGKMIFTIPKISSKNPTREGGENYASDELRRKYFGQEDHYRKFGFEFIDAIEKLDNVKLDVIYPTSSDNDAYGLGVLTDPVFVINRLS